MDHRTLAIVNITGSSLDVLGTLYLAYDLLGGEHGPLRALSRGVTYGIIFAVGYGIGLGPVFGIACGLAHAISLAWEFSRASRGLPSTGFWQDSLASAIRGIGHGIGGAWLLGPPFGILFGALSTVAQVAAYRIGIRPTMEYAPAPRVRLRVRPMLAAVNRTVGYGLAAGCLCALVAHRPDVAVWYGVRIGLTVGLVTAIMTTFTPLVEWGADQVPEKGMGVFGVALILLGFALQSVQYWFTLLDVRVS